MPWLTFFVACIVHFFFVTDEFVLPGIGHFPTDFGTVVEVMLCGELL